MVVQVEKYDGNVFQMELVAIPWESIVPMANRISDLDVQHRQSTVTMFQLFGYDHLVGRMTVTTHPNGVLEDGSVEALIIREADRDGVFRLQEGIRVVIVDVHHRHEAIGKLRSDMNETLNYARQPLPAFLDIRSNGQVLTAMDMTKTRILLNTASTSVLSCTSFQVVLHSVMAYAQTFNDAYRVAFGEARITSIRRNLRPADLTPQASPRTYDRYIRVARLCMRWDALLSFID